MGEVDDRIVRALRMIEADMAEEVVFDDIARSVLLSPSRFHHLFAEEVGCPPGVYLRRIRLDAAALRLRWTQDTVGRIAIGLGYTSQASFSHAFVRRFGVTPARFRHAFDKTLPALAPSETLGAIRVRDIVSFHVIAKRYVGDLSTVRRFWEDFERSLPGSPKTWSNEIFMGLLYDDPRMTAANEVRYDCCVTAGSGHLNSGALLRKRGLHIISTRPGSYCCTQFSGHRDHLAGAYQHLCDGWLKSSRYVVSDDPAIELHARPRHRMPPHELQLTLMIPLEA